MKQCHAVVAVTVFILAAMGNLSCTSKKEIAVTPEGSSENTQGQTLWKSQHIITLDLGNSVSMKLVLIPSGQFMMGSPETDDQQFRNEGPHREVTISKPFYMGIHEVTQEQYRAMMDFDPSKFKGASNPVEQVSWDDAVEFCKRLSQKTGKMIQLPTEAQWEYACRAGAKTRFYFGEDESQLGDYAWSSANSHGTTHPVGEKKPNAYGLYDMHGNVLEWCRDWYADSYTNANRVDPAGPALGQSRVLRGGSWNCPPRFCRSAGLRDGWGSRIRNYDLGFRVVTK